MKKSSLKFLVWFLIIFFGAFCFNSFSWAQPPMKEVDPIIPKTKFKKPPKLLTDTDLKVNYIYARTCPCSPELKIHDATLMEAGIYVTIINNPCSDGRKCNASGKVKVTYYDLAKGQFKTATKLFYGLKPNHSKDIRVVGLSVLAKISKGIKAEVIPDSPVKDCNPSNNIKTVYQCNIPIVK